MGAMVLTANAQKTVQGSGFYDNWSAGVVAGGITPTTHSAFFKNMRATYGVELTKQITPVFAIGAQFMAANNVSESATVFASRSHRPASRAMPSRKPLLSSAACAASVPAVA